MHCMARNTCAKVSAPTHRTFNWALLMGSTFLNPYNRKQKLLSWHFWNKRVYEKPKSTICMSGEIFRHVPTENYSTQCLSTSRSNSVRPKLKFLPQSGHFNLFSVVFLILSRVHSTGHNHFLMYPWHPTYTPHLLISQYVTYFLT